MKKLYTVIIFIAITFTFIQSVNAQKINYDLFTEISDNPEFVKDELLKLGFIVQDKKQYYDEGEEIPYGGGYTLSYTENSNYVLEIDIYDLDDRLLNEVDLNFDENNASFDVLNQLKAEIIKNAVKKEEFECLEISSSIMTYTDQSGLNFRIYFDRLTGQHVIEIGRELGKCEDY